MSNSEDWNSDISSLLNKIYLCADKKSWYDRVAEAYDRTRPRYPAKILARVREVAQFPAQGKILEIGSGPGIASIELAKIGLKMICLEPSLSACNLARRKCKNYLHVEFINTTFEEWQLESQQFDAVVATTSFHWVTPGIRTEKTAAALKENGLLILLWNTPPQPKYEVHQLLAEVYLSHAPVLAKYETHQNHQANLAKMGQEVIDSGYFKDLISEQLVSRVSYSVEDYLTLLSTLSPYIRLEPQQRVNLLTELAKVLKLNCGNQLELSYLSMMQIARKN
ncbi:class I SAM-dependent methyltransferase [Pleurocapsa sp. PCC 7319]|uniref:class I SAM-dependent methyltransferase n=1 Tax=Pleurocapsa sp. PCC 7319 TaxID=118161 RepID=UPI0003476D7E|nr:class I SAM-dependent methyltransferase [Pleurocapsa sp. PCC 7319]